MAKASSMLGRLISNAEPFHEITYTLSHLEDKNSLQKFENACGKAGLDEMEQKWLWNYLKNYNPELAAATDKKWSSTESLHW